MAQEHDGEACNASVMSAANGAIDDTNGTAAAAAVAAAAASTPSTFGYGVGLALLANTFVAVALCTQKYAHNHNKGSDGGPDKHFLKLPIWWLGILLNIFGEAGNAYAYSLAPASVVAPIGSVTVVINEIICVLFLNEKVRKRDLVGLVAVIGGVTLIIFGVPTYTDSLSIHKILSDDILYAPTAYGWLTFLAVLILVFTCVLEKRYAKEYILVWIMLCSSISSVTVAACRSFFSLVNQVPLDCAASTCVHGVLHVPCMQTLGHWFFWMMLGVILVTAVWSAMYLNQAMMYYGNTVVVPVYYCAFTIFSILGGALIYDELEGISFARALMFGGGVLSAICGVAVLMSNREPDLPPTGQSPRRAAAAAASGLRNNPPSDQNDAGLLGSPDDCNALHRSCSPPCMYASLPGASSSTQSTRDDPSKGASSKRSLAFPQPASADGDDQRDPSTASTSTPLESPTGGRSNEKRAFEPAAVREASMLPPATTSDSTRADSESSLFSRLSEVASAAWASINIFNARRSTKVGVGDNGECDAHSGPSSASTTSAVVPVHAFEDTVEPTSASPEVRRDPERQQAYRNGGPGQDL